MKAQPVTADRTATVDAPPSSSSASSANVKASTISLHPLEFHHFTELPDDVLSEVMYWLMQSTGSVDGIGPLAASSKRFLQAAQGFLSSASYLNAQAENLHRFTTKVTREFLKIAGFGLELIEPEDTDELNEHLRSVNENKKQKICYEEELVITHELATAPDFEKMDEFRRYKAPLLLLGRCASDKVDEMIVKIAFNLPPAVFLHVGSYFADQQELEKYGFSGLVKRVVESGRATGFSFEGNQLSKPPAEIEAVLDLACGKGVISFLDFEALEDPSPMLHALCERADRFRHLKLVKCSNVRSLDQEKIEALAAALQKRAAAGLSRLNVVIGCAEVDRYEGILPSMLTKKDIRRLDALGLYLVGVEINGSERIKIMRKVGSGHIDGVLPRPPRWANVATLGSSIVFHPVDDEKSSNPQLVERNSSKNS